jgi:hypothetical protein
MDPSMPPWLPALTLLSMIGLVLLIPLYFLPLLIALCRSHPQVMAIGALNILLGWTFLGWVACAVWSCTAIRRHVGGLPPAP